MAEKRYTEYIIAGIIDGMTEEKQTRPDIALLKQRLCDLNAEINAYNAEINDTTQKSKDTGGKNGRTDQQTNGD